MNNPGIRVLGTDGDGPGANVWANLAAKKRQRRGSMALGAHAVQLTWCRKSRFGSKRWPQEVLLDGYAPCAACRNSKGRECYRRDHRQWAEWRVHAPGAIGYTLPLWAISDTDKKAVRRRRKAATQI